MGRKQITLTVALIIIILFGAKDLFIRHFPVEISFDAKGEKIVEFQIFYSKKKNNFTEADSQRKKVTLNEKFQKVSFSPIFSGFRYLRIDFGSNPGKLQLTNFRLKGKTSLQLKEFADNKINQIDSFSSSEGDLEIISHRPDPYMIMSQKIDIGGYKIDYSLFFIIASLAFLVSFLLVKYLSVLKIVEHHSRIDIVFVCIFFIVLFIPMSKINHSEKSIGENRLLQEYEPLVVDGGGLNYKYGKSFEQWFNDRFNGRESLLRIYSWLKLNVNKYYSNGKSYIGKDGWMFNDGYYEYFKKIQDSRLEKYAENIYRFVRECRDKNITPYIFIAPIKEDIYREYGNRNLRNQPDNVQLLQKYVKNKYNIDIIYPREELIKAKHNGLVMFKTDHHWTEYGALVGYQSLGNRLQKDFPDIPEVTENDYIEYENKLVRNSFWHKFTLGHTYRLLNMNKPEILDTPYKYYRHKKEQLLSVKIDGKDGKKYFPNIDGSKGKVEFFYSDGYNKKALLIGNSFTENFLTFLPYNFRQTQKLVTNWYDIKKDEELFLQRFSADIEAYKPDIIIILFNAFYLDHLSDMYKD